jgi:hypothetical protein
MARRRRTASGRFTKRAHTKRRRHRRNPAAGTRLSRRSSRRARRRYTNLTAHRKGYYPNRPRRRRRFRANSHRRRRSYRRNPGFGLDFLVSGLKDGAVVFAAQVANRKVANLVQQYVPGLSIVSAAGTPSLVGIFGSRVIAASAVTLLARKVTPNLARLVAAGAFADAIGATLANVPSVAPYLGATALIRRAGVRGYPMLPGGNGLAAVRRGVAGYPRSQGLPANVGGM